MDNKCSNKVKTPKTYHLHHIDLHKMYIGLVSDGHIKLLFGSLK